MARALMMTRSHERTDEDQGQLMKATQAYFEALPLLHKGLIEELSAQREEAPVALLGKAIADGLELILAEISGSIQQAPAPNA